MSDKLTSETLFNHLFEACNILRGPINQDEFKSYVTPILFFKRLCDVYDEECDDILDEFDGDQEALLFPENHRFIIPDGCHWNDVREKTENIGSAISNSMTKIERANPDTLYGVFSSFDDANWTDKNKLSDERLKDLVEHFSKIKVGNKNYSADVMGDAYEFLIKKFADLSKKNAGEFYTPRAVVKLLVKMLDPKAGETVYDPACGTGGMLIEAIRYMNDDKKTYGKIFGQEKNLSTSAIARMNLFLHGAVDFKIVQGDTLRNPAFISMGELAKFDCVIANPPFSLKNWGSTQFKTDPYGRNVWGTPPEANGDYAWIQHMIASMADKVGRCAVVLPQGALFKSGLFQILRKNMIESHKLKCVITLAGNIFYSTPLQASLLLFSNESENDSIYLIDASKIFTAKRAQNVLEEKDIDKIFDVFKSHKNTDISYIASYKDIEAKNFDLTISKYFESEDVDLISFDLLKNRILGNLNKVKENDKTIESKLMDGGFLNE